jgi:hypothetical protein
MRTENECEPGRMKLSMSGSGRRKMTVNVGVKGVKVTKHHDSISHREVGNGQLELPLEHGKPRVSFTRFGEHVVAESFSSYIYFVPGSTAFSEPRAIKAFTPSHLMQHALGIVMFVEKVFGDLPNRAKACNSLRWLRTAKMSLITGNGATKGSYVPVEMDRKLTRLCKSSLLCSRPRRSSLAVPLL